MVKTTDNSNERNLKSGLPRTGKGVVVDIGTGDGRFVYQSARENPDTFYIGVDANPQALEKISLKLERNPSKGGAPNLMFVQAAVEALPSELDVVADVVHVHFPWGSLLRAVATGDAAVLANLRRICAPDGLLEVVIGQDVTRDKTELDALGVPELTDAYLGETLVPRYEASGFRVLDYGAASPSEWDALNTTWAKRLAGGAGRTLVYLVAEARV